MKVTAYRVLLVAGLAALGFFAFLFNASGHETPFSTNLGFAATAVLLLLLIWFTPRILR